MKQPAPPRGGCARPRWRRSRTRIPNRRRTPRSSRPAAPPDSAPGRTRLSRNCMRAASTPQPLCTAMYCLPSTWNDIGTPLTPDGIADLAQHLAVRRIERTELAVVGAALEQHVAGGGQQRTPVLAHAKVVGPDLLAGVEIPGLHFADMIGALAEIQPARHAGVRLTGDIGDGTAEDRAAEVLVGRDVEQLGLRAVGDRRPILATPEARAEIRHLAGARLVFLARRSGGRSSDRGR